MTLKIKKKKSKINIELKSYEKKTHIIKSTSQQYEGEQSSLNKESIRIMTYFLDPCIFIINLTFLEFVC